MADIGVIGGSGFYSFLSDAHTVEIDTPFGPPSEPPVVGDLDGREVAFIPGTAQITGSRRIASTIEPTCGLCGSSA